MERPSPSSFARPRFGLVVSLLLLLGAAAFVAPNRALLDARNSSSQRQASLSGEVVGVSDGDTIRVLASGKSCKIRLYGVDSPEKKQSYGMKAKQFTSSLVFGRNVNVTILTSDRYGRFVGIVRLDDGRVLNNELVRNGLAWWYEHYAPHDKNLQALELEARREKRHLWSDPDAMAPWEFRRRGRQHSAHAL